MAARSSISSGSSDDKIIRWQKDVSRSLSSEPTNLPPTSSSGTKSAPENRIVRVMTPTTTAPDQASTVYVYRTELSPIRKDPVRDDDVGGAKAVVGTLLGAAGGAAVAYAMMKAESKDDSARDRTIARLAQPERVSRIDHYISHMAPSVSRAGHEHGTTVGQQQSIGSKRSATDYTTLISTFIPAASTTLKMLEGSRWTSTQPQVSNHDVRPAQILDDETVESARRESPPRRARSSRASNASTKDRRPEATPSLSAPLDPLPESVRGSTLCARPDGCGTVIPADSVSNVSSGLPRRRGHSKGHTSRTHLSSASSRTRRGRMDSPRASAVSAPHQMLFRTNFDSAR